ncbi:threonine ammonia-lyase [Risungbinella massiliensis]|uniref:threonine ammonia-lyase n=1 Tax=Risungbinella massiliensis TaxID=1329796 RepID=UPI0005CC4D45|nr:threonine/serine dehydratase [Risungbinella massiliensis]
MQLSIFDIIHAKNRMKNHIVETPFVFSDRLSAQLSANVYFKLENLQKTGSFKARGALSKISALTNQEKKKGVITASSGNHAQAVSYAASLFDTSALVVVPENTAQAKISGIQRFGGEIVQYGTSYDEAEEYAEQLAKETGRMFIHAFNDVVTMAGQGTIGLEAMLEKPDFDVILVPVGGGGLLNGIATVAKAINPDVQIIGVQSEASPAWHESFMAGKMVDVTYQPSIADGIYGGIHEAPLQLAFSRVDGSLIVSEESIAHAMKWMATNHRYIIEGSSAVTIAALLQDQVQDIAGKNVLCIITGGNVDASLFMKVMNAHE